MSPVSYFQNLNNFLAQPNVLEYLDISSTDTTLESVSLPFDFRIAKFLNSKFLRFSYLVHCLEDAVLI